MFDKGFDEPNYEIGGGYDNYGDEAQEGFDKKQIIKFAIIGVVILAIIAVAFIILTSSQTVEFRIREMDGSTISQSLVILNENGEQVYSGRDTIHVVTLSPGNYTYRVSSMNHKPYHNTLTIGGDQTPQSEILIELEKDIDVRLTAKVGQEEVIYVNQEITRVLEINNLGAAQINNLEIIPSSRTFNVELTTNNVSISSGGSTSVTFSIKTRSDEHITSKKDETIEFRVKGTSQMTSFPIELRPSIRDSEITVSRVTGIRGASISGSNLTIPGLTLGQTDKLQLTIGNTNRSGIDVENILVEILPEPGYDDKITWFDFLGHSDQKSEIVIDKIEARDNTVLNLNITPNINDEVGSEFRGRLKISSLGIQRDIELNMLLTVDAAPEDPIKLSGRTSFSTRCNLSDVACAEIDTRGLTSIENNLQRNISNIELFVVSPPISDNDCEPWIIFREDRIPLLRAEEEIELNWNINPSPYAEKRFTRCFIGWTHDDPNNPGERISGRQEIGITVNVSN